MNEPIIARQLWSRRSDVSGEASGPWDQIPKNTEPAKRVTDIRTSVAHFAGSHVCEVTDPRPYAQGYSAASFADWLSLNTQPPTHHSVVAQSRPDESRSSLRS